MAHDNDDISDFWENVPDDFEEWRAADQVQYWADWYDVYLPPDYFFPYEKYGNDVDDGGLGGDYSNVRGVVFASPIDACEYLWGTGIFPWSTVLFDEDGFYYVATTESDGQ